jgi:hypothetical protein
MTVQLRNPRAVTMPNPGHAPRIGLRQPEPEAAGTVWGVVEISSALLTGDTSRHVVSLANSPSFPRQGSADGFGKAV